MHGQRFRAFRGLVLFHSPVNGRLWTYNAHWNVCLWWCIIYLYLATPDANLQSQHALYSDMPFSKICIARKTVS